MAGLDLLDPFVGRAPGRLVVDGVLQDLGFRSREHREQVTGFLRGCLALGRLLNRLRLVLRVVAQLEELRDAGRPLLLRLLLRGSHRTEPEALCGWTRERIATGLRRR